MIEGMVESWESEAGRGDWAVIISLRGVLYIDR
jgi:hypothetical protein